MASGDTVVHFGPSIEEVVLAAEGYVLIRNTNVAGITILDAPTPIAARLLDFMAESDIRILIGCYI